MKFCSTDNGIPASFICIALFVTVLFPACDSGPGGPVCGAGPGKPLNLLLITLDTARADHFGCYGSDKVLTPHMDRLAEESALFLNATAAAPLTLPSHASLFTGMYPF
ncbi:MAG: sulfatase-like hydrolase/transferase, partial [Planctomycetes bacterium]|nr:sulfatase-like hydrolase/transferase [Planctomycetota bacterium]